MDKVFVFRLRVTRGCIHHNKYSLMHFSSPTYSSLIILEIDQDILVCGWYRCVHKLRAKRVCWGIFRLHYLLFCLAQSGSIIFTSRMTFPIIIRLRSYKKGHLRDASPSFLVWHTQCQRLCEKVSIMHPVLVIPHHPCVPNFVLKVLVNHYIISNDTIMFTYNSQNVNNVRYQHLQYGKFHATSVYFICLLLYSTLLWKGYD